MQQENNKEVAAPTLRQLIQNLGKRTNVINEALKLLQERGHEYSKSALYTTVERNGTNNADIEAALLDAIEAERSKKASTVARRQALAA
jgi:DNA-binding transcriptional regulator YhcF (GntR family)